MIESEFNSIVTHSFNSLGWYAFKIPDERSTITGFHSKNPYDLFGIYDGRFIAWESKWLQKPMSFNFNELKEHQIANLIKSFELCRDSVSVFAIGVDFGRADKRVYVWKNEDLYTIRERKINHDNILKKEFISRSNYVKISKGVIPLDELFALPSDGK